MTNYDERRVEEIEKIMSLEDAEKNEQKALDHNNLITAFTKDNQVIYPEHYAGAYINEEQELIIFDCNSQSNRKYYSQKCGSNSIKVEIKRFSYIYLKSILDIINNAIFLNQFPEIISNIHSVSILERENRIKVGLRTNSTEKQNEFLKEIVSSEAIKFVEEKGKHIEDALGPGGEIGSGSGAYRAISRIGSAAGFVTSAHTTTLGSTINGPTGQVLGTVTQRIYGGELDASFVTSNGNYSLTNQFQNSPYLLSAQTELLPTVGTLVLMHGKNTPISSGLIDQVGYTRPSGTDFPTLTNQIVCTYNSESGDSGAIVCTSANMYRLGIHVGRPSDLGGQYAMCSSARIANTTMSLTGY